MGLVSVSYFWFAVVLEMALSGQKHLRNNFRTFLGLLSTRPFGFDLSVSSVTRNRADQPIRPSACARQWPERSDCAARGRLRVLDFGRTTFGGQLKAAKETARCACPSGARFRCGAVSTLPKRQAEQQAGKNHKNDAHGLEMKALSSGCTQCVKGIFVQLAVA